MQFKPIRLVILYLASIVLSLISTVFYYFYLYGADLGPIIIVIAVYIVPLLFLGFSILFDLLYLKNIPQLNGLMLSLLYLPLMISLHLIIVTIDNMRMFSEAVCLWCFLLFVPLFLEIIYAWLCRKFAFYNLKIFLIIKYSLTILVYLYGFVTWFVYRLVGMGV